MIPPENGLNSMATTYPSRIAVLGVPFHNVTMEETIAFIDEKIRQRGFHQIATANVDFLIHAIRDPEMQQILCSCDLVIPDGMPILWGARMLGSALKQRVCGVDLVPRVAELCAREGHSLFLLGSTEQNSARCAENLKQRYPGLRIAGRYCPPVMPLERMNHEEILRRIERAKPDILLVALGNPKQERWLAMHRRRLNVPVCIGVGGSIDFVAGAMKRAPLWMQSSGLEWLYRLLQEPNRLLQRYVGDACGFARYMPQQFLAMAMQPRHKAKSGVFADEFGNTTVISIYGDLTGEMLEEFNALSRTVIDCRMNLVLSLSQAHYIGPDGLGSMIAMATEMRNVGGQLWLAEVPGHLQRVLNSSRLAGLFMTTTSIRDALHRTERAEQRSFHNSLAVQGLERLSDNPVQVRVEILQDVCRKVTAAHTNTPFDTVDSQPGYAYNDSMG
jgi:N-acetylglucosaminyldiphosphoundecaprenol N-acetyl-beta-D-mannosaminyltransferase